MNKSRISDIVKKIYKGIGATGLMFVLVFLTFISGWAYFLIVRHPGTSLSNESQTVTYFAIAAGALFVVLLIERLYNVIKSKRVSEENENVY
ncbi:hypothetical protein PRVXH_002386 [Proteinivorax hydrogeniformans]|uniref:Uncharacterized protein n=1 Tax=Proteinivorax hydrogeniformans TaxID=1826727 RepID=A0AAU8HSK0_9FIRM